MTEKPEYLWQSRSEILQSRRRQVHGVCILMMAALFSWTPVLASDWYDPSENDADMTIKQAVEQAHMPRLRELLEQRGKLQEPEKSELTVVAAYNGNAEALRLLLEHGAEADVFYPWASTEEWSAPDYVGPTHVISRAAQRGYARVIELLLAVGVDPNLRDRADTTPLHWAAFYGNVPSVAVLLAAGANVHARTDYGATPLHFAAQGAPDRPVRGRSHSGIIAALIAAGADVSARTKRRTPAIEDEIPFWGGTEENADNMVQLMVTGEKTPLHLAAGGCEFFDKWVDSCMSRQTSDAVAVLVEAGADKYAKDQFGETPISYAQEAVSCGICDETDDRYYYLSGESRRQEGSGWGVAFGTFTAFAAMKAGMSEQEAKRVGVQAAQDLEEDGLQATLINSAEDFNRNLENQQREIDRLSAAIRTHAQKNNVNVRVPDNTEDSMRVARRSTSTEFERCIGAGKEIADCAREVRGLATPTDSGSDTSVAGTGADSSGQSTELTSDSVQAPEASESVGAVGNEDKDSQQLAEGFTNEEWKHGVPEAVTYCWAHEERNPNLDIQSKWFRCHGPNDVRTHQMTGLGWGTIESHLPLIGCEGGNLEGAVQWEHGYIIMCDNGIASYHVDVANERGILDTAIPHRGLYKCRRQFAFHEGAFHEDRYDCPVGKTE